LGVLDEVDGNKLFQWCNLVVHIERRQKAKLFDAKVQNQTGGEIMSARISRRQFLKGAAIAGVGAALPLGFGKGKALAFYQTNSPPLSKWATAFRGVGPGQIPVVATDGLAPITGVAHATVDIGQFTDVLHPSLNPTHLWGFNPRNALGSGGVQTFNHLSGIIVVNRGEPLQLTFNNMLPAYNIIPVDKTMPGANAAQNRVAVHLHGGFIPWISDGGPFDWWTPNGTHGLSFLNNNVLNPGNIGTGKAEYYYGNDQSARLMWYHDHAFGITRINAYAGIASAYVIRDNFEKGRVTAGILPPFIETSVLGNQPVRELPIVIQDKVFVGTNINAVDPTWKNVVPPAAQGQGSLWYPHVYEKNRWRLIGAGRNLPNPSVIAEMFGDTMLANGTVYPTVNVDPTQYRFRILNACNARFLNLQLRVENQVGNIQVNIPDGIAHDQFGVVQNDPGPDWTVIGTEGGFLPAPVTVPTAPFVLNADGTYTGSLITGNAERWDVVVDFKNFAGKTLILYTDAPAPFPGGDPRNDYYYQNPLNPVGPTPGFGPDTRQIMRIVVNNVTPFDIITVPNSSNFQPQQGTDIDMFLARNNPDGTYALINGTVVPAGNIKGKTLNEIFDAYGRLTQNIGTDVVGPSGILARKYLDPATETPAAGSTEIWEIFNLTGDTHPIHFHLVNVQILNRQIFDAAAYTPGAPTFLAPPRPPDADEVGWKETVRMNPGEVIRVIMKFTLPPDPPNVAIPNSPRTGGKEYVWHCHILEHEEHDMMRPLVVG
jgi:spore coat protein A, manganese oxidase